MNKFTGIAALVFIAALMGGCDSDSSSGSTIDLDTIGGSTNIQISDFSLTGAGVKKEDDGSYTLVADQDFSVSFVLASGKNVDRRIYLSLTENLTKDATGKVVNESIYFKSCNDTIFVTTCSDAVDRYKYDYNNKTLLLPKERSTSSSLSGFDVDLNLSNVGANSDNYLEQDSFYLILLVEPYSFVSGNPQQRAIKINWP